jgi:hypothetical protein
MQTTKPKGPQLARPGPIGLAIRVVLGVTVLYWFAALLTKWSGFMERDPIESGRLYTLFTIWWLPETSSFTASWEALSAGSGSAGRSPMLRPGQARQMPWLTAVDCSRPLLRAHGGHAGLLRSCAGADGVRVGPRPAEPAFGVQ